MNKRLLILVGVVLCLFINIIVPIKVNALEDDEFTDNQPQEVELVEEEGKKANPPVEEEVPKQVEELEEDETLLPKLGAAPANSNEEELEEAPKQEEAVLSDTKTGEPEEVPAEVTLEETNEPQEVDEPPEIEYGEVFDIQKVKVITTKVDEEGNMLPGAKLQILDQNGKVLDEWTSTEEAHTTLLPDGTYTLHEVEAPEGYDIADDKEIIVKVEIAELDAGSNASATPCPHYTGTQMYYVQIAGKKHEVYCINQNWDTPDADSVYDGEILNAGSIRDFTKQTIPVSLDEDNPINFELSKKPVDISDQSLSDDELYDKILDIIYHRHTATEDLAKQGLTYTNEEIRFITEVALKNYTNPGLTERQYQVKATEALLAAFDAAGVVYKTYVSKGTTYVSYLKHNYRDYVYNPDVDLGQDIVKTDYGKGDSFGQMVAGHWNSFSRTDSLHPAADPDNSAHDAKNNPNDRATVARYYELYKYLISSNNPHPEEMHLYIYSSKTTPADPAGNNYDDKYQNLLGVTGYFEDIKQQELEVEMVNKYSTETRSVKVTKVWADDDNEEKKRPESVTVTLLANGKEYDTIVLSEENEWKHEFTDLPVYNLGEKIEYTVREENVPEGYVASYEEDGETGFIIHNVKGQGGDEPPPDNPQTGDNIVLYLIALLISIIGLVSGRKYLIEIKN